MIYKFRQYRENFYGAVIDHYYVYVGITIHKGDVCNQQMLEHLFDAHNFSHVVHLSAKEGHQKSMEDPSSFIKANVECLLTLLKVLARHKVY